MRAALYCRLSEEDRAKASPEDDSESIQNQKAMLRAYARERGWEIYREYSDDDYAGADRSRPAFRQLLQDARARAFDVVLCKSQSRFTREMEIVEKYLHGLFPQWGVRFIGVVDHADTADKGNKKARQINGLVNEWYLEDMSDSIRSVLDTKRRQGYHIGSFALYGYRKDPARKGRLLIDEEAAAVVRQVFQWFADGCGKTEIARRLNARGVPNPTAYKQEKGLSYRQPQNSARWSYAAVARLLANEMYRGDMVQGRYGSASYKTKKNRPRPREAWFRVQGTHEPLIDRELWERVQRRLRERARPFAGGEIGAFAYKLRCMACGYTLRACKSGGRRYFKCPTHAADPAACPGAFVAQESLERALADELARVSEACCDLEKPLWRARPARGPSGAPRPSGKPPAPQTGRAQMERALAGGIPRALVETMVDFIAVGTRQGDVIPVEIHWSF